MFTALTGQRAHQPTPRGYHQRTMSGVYQARTDFQRTTFYTAGLQRRKHLKYG
jgi:hypothetical protein